MKNVYQDISLNLLIKVFKIRMGICLKHLYVQIVWMTENLLKEHIIAINANKIIPYIKNAGINSKQKLY